MTDAEWAVLEPLLPPASRVGRPRKLPLRRIVEAILYLLRGGLPSLYHVLADGGYAGTKLKDALRRIGKWTVAIVKRSDTAKGFEVLPRRWVVERTLAWISRNRRLAKDFEQTIAFATAWLFIASIQLFIRRIARL
jgi:transposase